MAKTIANVEVTYDTMETLIAKLNTALDTLTYDVVTANTTGGTTGNTSSPRIAILGGTSVANTVVAVGDLRGGNSSASGNLTVSSNVSFTGGQHTSSSNSLYTNTQFFTANVQSNGALFAVYGGTLNVSSNTLITSSSIVFKANSTVTTFSMAGNSTVTNTAITSTTLYAYANTTISGNSHTVAGNVNFDSATLFVDSVNNRVGIGNSSPDASITVTGTANISANVFIGGNLTTAGIIQVTNTFSSGNTTVTGFANISGAANVGGALTVTNTASVGNTTITGFANISGSANVGGTLLVDGASTFVNTVSVGGALTVGTEFVVDVYANSNIGNNSSSRVVYSFPKATYRSGKILAFATNTGNNQLSEMVVAHDNTTAFVSVYGVVASPFAPGNTESPLGTYTANINNANVEISMTQVYSNSAVKIVAQLIK